MSTRSLLLGLALLARTAGALVDGIGIGTGTGTGIGTGDGVPAAPATPAAAQPEAVRIIVHPGTPVNSLSREEVSRVFLKKLSRWDGGVPVAPVDLAEASPTRDEFSRAFHHRAADMVTLYWQRQIFSGRQTPPPEKSSEADVIAYVRSTPGAIGYVSTTSELRGVRVVTVTGR